MSEQKRRKVTMLVLGRSYDPILDLLVKFNDIQLNIVCFNLLDFSINDESIEPIKFIPWELVKVLEQTSVDIKNGFPVPSKVKETLLAKNKFGFTENQLSILYNINQVESFSKDIKKAYDILEGQVGRENVKIVPLAKDIITIGVFKQKKWAPLRLFEISGELPFDAPPTGQPDDKKKNNYSSKELTTFALDELASVKWNEDIKNLINESDLILLSPTDAISLEVFLQADQIVQSFKKASPLNKVALLWNTKHLDNLSGTQQEMLRLLGFEDRETFDKQIADIADFIILDQNAPEDEIQRLLDLGVKTVKEAIPTKEELEATKDSSKFGILETLSNIAQIPMDIGDGDSEVDEQGEQELKEAKSALSINEIRELPEELDEEKPIETAQEKESETIQEQVTEGKQETQVATPVEFTLDETLSFEEKIATAVRAVVKNHDVNAQSWLQTVCSGDHDQEVLIASYILTKTIDTENHELKKNYINLINFLYLNDKQSYEQILTQKILSGINSLDEEALSKIVDTFSLLKVYNIELCEIVVTNLLNPIATPNEINPVITELGKLTLLQIVLDSKRLSRLTISGLLNILDARTDPSSEIWNILTAFNAAMVGIELIVNFSKDRAEELIRRTPLLRYTGSFINTINKIMVYWKEGDKQAIANLTGSVLPTQMVRKLERIDLARKIRKLRVVPLTTLAETLNMDPKKLEVMIAEMVMKDDLDIKMEVLDGRMVIVYDGPEEADDD